MRYFPSLLPALIFSPNNRARKKVLSVMKRYVRTMGLPKAGDVVKSLVLAASASVEWARILFNRAPGMRASSASLARTGWIIRETGRWR
jgi:hypothetical protein